jgi:hypothetical protein
MRDAVVEELRSVDSEALCRSTTRPAGLRVQDDVRPTLQRRPISPSASHRPRAGGARTTRPIRHTSRRRAHWRIRAPPRAHAMLKQAREHHKAIVTIIRDWRPDLLEELVSDLSWPPRCSAPGPTRDGSTRRWPSRCSPAYHPGRWPQRQELARPLPRDRSARSWSGGRSAEHFKRRTTRERLSQPGQSRALAISLPAVSG